MSLVTWFQDLPCHLGFHSWCHYWAMRFAENRVGVSYKRRERYCEGCGIRQHRILDARGRIRWITFENVPCSHGFLDWDECPDCSH